MVNHLAITSSNISKPIFTEVKVAQHKVSISTSQPKIMLTSTFHKMSISSALPPKTVIPSTSSKVSKSSAYCKEYTLSSAQSVSSSAQTKEDLAEYDYYSDSEQGNVSTRAMVSSIDKSRYTWDHKEYTMRTCALSTTLAVSDISRRGDLNSYHVEEDGEGRKNWNIWFTRYN
ncbi:unnamed protein product [Gordionus sp. m RMFG-2023]